MEKNYSLYVISTPIGNLDDISFRALECLRAVDFILCEDTRQTVKLTNHYDIGKKLVAYHKFNENEISDRIINRLAAGERAALVSDAGTPLISDPGSILIKKAIENNISFCVIPGANAVLPSLIMSGFDTSSFIFWGFLPKKKNEKTERLRSALSSRMTGVFYVAPHELKEVLSLLNAISPMVRLSLTKELTKLYEHTWRGTPDEILALLPETVRGEYTLTVDAGALCPEEEAPDTEKIKEIFSAYTEQTGSKKTALMLTAEKTGLKKNDLYDLLMKD